LETGVLAPLVTRFPRVSLRLDPARTAGRGYYASTCFDISKVDSGQQLQLVDGGFTTWTRQLLNNQKERLLIGGLGTERLQEQIGTRRPSG
jgi:hypothetical protein